VSRGKPRDRRIHWSRREVLRPRRSVRSHARPVYPSPAPRARAPSSTSVISISPMARKRRSRKRSRGDKFEATRSSEQGDHATWSGLDQAFFAAAPPDDPGPPPEAPCFDDLSPAAPPERSVRLTRRLVAALSTPPWSRRRVAIALASVCLLICVFAVVIVFGRQTRPKSAVDPARPATNSGAGKSPSASSTRSAGPAYGS